MSKVSTLLIKETNELERVKQFLNSKARKSPKTKTTYSIALSHFQTFLHKSEFKNYNAETILIPLVQEKINVYSLLDRFVGYLIDIKTKLSYQSFIVYIAGVKSYLEYYDVDISSNKFRKKVTLPSKDKRTKELDFLTVETVGKDFESKLEERANEIDLMELKHEKDVKEMDQKLNKIISAILKNPQLSKIKPEVLKRKIK